MKHDSNIQRTGNEFIHCWWKERYAKKTKQVCVSGTGPVNTLDGCENIWGWS